MIKKWQVNIGTANIGIGLNVKVFTVEWNNAYQKAVIFNNAFTYVNRT